MGLAFLCTFSVAQGLESEALPVNPEIVDGSAVIHATSDSLIIHQKTHDLIINWDEFNIGETAHVAFIQPEFFGVALNRVVGSVPSEIYGHLTSNGTVFLLNPNGVLFGPQSQVDVGGLVASTLDLSFSDIYDDMPAVFRATQHSGPIYNQGKMTANEDGIIFFAPKIVNEGSLVAKEDSVILVAGQTVTIGLDENYFLQIEVDKTAASAYIENSGTIQADGGEVMIMAGQADDLMSSVINHTGLIQSRTLYEGAEGRVFLSGEGGITSISGKIDAPEDRIEIEGDKVVFAQEAIEVQE